MNEVGDDVALRARVEQDLGYAWLFRGDLEASERHARSALDLAEELQEPRLMAEAFQAYPFVEFLLGRGVDREMLDRGVALEGHMSGEFISYILRASFVLAQLLKFTDRLDEARETFNELLGAAAVRGVESPIPQIQYHLAELECWAGNWGAAMEHARESMAAVQRQAMGSFSSMAHFAVGLVEAHLGRSDAARLGSPRGVAPRRGGRRDPPAGPEPVGPRVPGTLLGQPVGGASVPLQGGRARASDGRSGARLLPDRPRRGRGARGPRAARRGRGAPRAVRGRRQEPRPGVGHGDGSQVPGARVRGPGRSPRCIGRSR